MGGAVLGSPVVREASASDVDGVTWVEAEGDTPVTDNECQDKDNPDFQDASGGGCAPYMEGDVACGEYDTDTWKAAEVCCACVVIPTESPTESATESPTASDDENGSRARLATPSLLLSLFAVVARVLLW